MSSLCTLLHSRYIKSVIWNMSIHIQAILPASCFTEHPTGFASCWHNLCLSLSSRQTDMLLASRCPPSMKPDEVSAFSIFISFRRIFFCPLKTCWGQEDCLKPLTATFKLNNQQDYLSDMHLSVLSSLFTQFSLPTCSSKMHQCNWHTSYTSLLMPPLSPV